MEPGKKDFLQGCTPVNPSQLTPMGSISFSSVHFKFHNIQIFKELNNIKHKLQSINYNTNIKLNITTEILENL